MVNFIQLITSDASNLSLALIWNFSVASSKENPSATAAQEAFRHSRIYAEGWNAARLLATGIDPASAEAAALNPYASEPERSRWREGFSRALGLS